MASKNAQCPSKPCEICSRGSGKFYCLECNQLYCEECKAHHLKMTQSKFHQFKGVTEVDGESKCVEHGKKYNFVCLTCNTFVCEICVTESHDRHKLSKVEKWIKQNKQIVKDKLKNLRKNEEELSVAFAQFDSKVESVINAIQDQGKRIKAFIDKEIEQIIKELKLNAKAEQDKFTKHKKEAQKREQACAQLERDITELTLSSTQQIVTEKLKHIVHELECFQIPSQPKFPNVTYEIPTLKEDTILQNIGMYKITSYENVSSKQKQSKKGGQRKIVYRCNNQKCSKDKVFDEG